MSSAQLTSKVQQQGGELLAGAIPRRTYGQHRYNLRNIHTAAEKERMVKKWNTRRYPKFRRNLRFHLDMLEQLLTRAQQRGLHPVLVELPLDRELVGDRFDYAITQYYEPVEVLAAEHGVPYLDFNAGLHIADRDFHDLTHLVEPGAWSATPACAGSGQADGPGRRRARRLPVSAPSPPSTTAR